MSLKAHEPVSVNNYFINNSINKNLFFDKHDKASFRRTEISEKRLISRTNHIIHALIIGNRLKILTYFEKDFLSAQLSPGDLLVVMMQPVKPEQNGNPAEFNYRDYLNKKGIYYQSFIKTGKWKIICKEGKSRRHIYKKIRHLFVAKIKQVNGNREQMGIIAALGTGSKEYLDDEIRESYSETGAMHVLAVSGLHVGLVWYVFNIIFGQLKKNPFTRVFYLIIMLFLLWFYVLITGMSASVLRAGIMLDFDCYVHISEKGNFKYHPVYLSGFIQLIINPVILTDVGFQLSYSAVLSILFFQPKIKRHLQSKNKLINYFFELTSVSLAAQLGTSILCIYYFNRFPVYFLLTNYVVIPLVTLILVLIIISAFCWYITPLFELLTRVELFITGIMNKGVKLIELLPYSSIDNIYIDNFEMLLFFSILIMIQIVLVNKKRIYPRLIFITFCIIIIYGGVRNYLVLKKPFILLYNIPGLFALELFDSNCHYFITSDLTENNKNIIIKNCKKFWLEKGRSEPLFIDINMPGMSYKGLTILRTPGKGLNLIVFHNLSIAIPDFKEKRRHFENSYTLYPDFLIINKYGIDKVPDFISLSKIKHIIISSEYKGRGHSLNLTDEEIKRPVFHDVRDEGAFIYYLK